MDFKSRLLRTAFVLPLMVATTPAPIQAFDIRDSGDNPQTTSVDTESTSADLNSDNQHELASTGIILIDGSPTNDNTAVLVNSDDVNVVIDGPITIRSHKDDGTATDRALDAATGVKITGDNAGRSIRLNNNAEIVIVEGISLADRRGPDYDADEDGFADNDSDEDGISEGSPALLGNDWRVGLWKVGEVSTNIIGEAGSSITIYGNGVGAPHVAGVVISDLNLDANLDLSTEININGDGARGVDILATITGNYRQRGNVDVRGEDTVGVDIGADITGSLMIEGLVNATGFSTIPRGSAGGPARGGADYTNDDFDEFSSGQQAANVDERRQSRAAVEIAADIGEGVIINGRANNVLTRDESRSFSCDADEDDTCDADGINIQRAEGADVTDLKIAPYHYDENRGTARLTSHGESEATLLITGSLAATNQATKETFLDTTDDDNDDDPDVDDDSDNIDFYDSTQAFFYSHGLMNRGSIEANTLYDAVKSGSYVIDLNATAIKLNDNEAYIHGGIYNSGTILALAYNGNATAVDLADGVFTDGQRNDDIVFLNEGTIRATIATHAKSYENIDEDDKTATAVKFGSDIDYDINSDSTPVFVNRGSVSATSSHTKLNAETTDIDDDYETITGTNAIAFDFRDVDEPVDFNLTQEMRKADALVNENVDNGNGNPYKGGGDTDIDRGGAADDDGNVIGDGVIDTRDVSAPSIVGDIKFNGGDNTFTMMAGTMRGNIDFGAGDDDAFLIGNSMEDDANDADDEDDDYTAPITTFRGVIQNSGTLDITVGDQDSNIAAEKTRLHFDGQEGVDTDGDGVQDIEYEDELTIHNLTMREAADLRFSINPDFLGDEVLDVTSLNLGTDVTISPFVTTLIEEDVETVKLIDYGSFSDASVDIEDRLEEDGHPYVYNVTLSDDGSAISAEFRLKSASEIGLNKNESNAYPAVINHFRENDALEARITEIDDQEEFQAYFGQLLPHYGDGTMKQLSGLADAATGAVSQHLQIANAGGRRGGDGWAQQFGDYRKQDGSAQTDHVSGTSYGLALGYDAPAGVVNAVGMYAQMSFTSVHEKPVLLPNAISPDTDEVMAESFAFGAYLADEIGPLSYELNASTGSVAMDSVRGVNFNGTSDSLRGSWDGTSTAASARLAYPILDFMHLLRLEAGVDYFALEQDGYSERSSFTTIERGLAMHLSSAESDMTSQFIGLRGGYASGGGSSTAVVWEPNYYIGYRSVSDYTPYTSTANFIGSNDTFTLVAQDEPSDSVDIGLGLAAHNDYFAFEFNYRGKFGDDEEVHGGGISIRLLF